MKKTTKKSEKTEALSIPQVEINAPLAIEQTQTPKMEDETIKIAQRKWYGGIALFALFMVAIAVVGGGYKGILSPSLETNNASPTPRVIPSPPPIVSMRVAVWNGSGIVGRAGKIGDALKGDGYTVYEVKNAPAIQSGSTLFLSPSLKQKEQELRSALLKINVIITDVQELKNSTDEARIVLGY